MILHIQQGLKEDGFTVSMTKLCRWFEVPRRTVYYKPVKSTPKVQERFCRADQANDRSRALVWLSNRGELAAVQ
jgi:putative transposase